MAPGKSAPARRSSSWAVAVALLAICAAGGSAAAWTVAMREIDRQVEQTRSGLKKLHLAGRVPPNKEVLSYLESRTATLTAHYEQALTRVAPAIQTGTGEANPQLHFQERVHDVQRTLERLAAARGMEVPLQLGFPKELPPADAVPQLLIQLDLVQDAAELVVPQPISKLVSVKLEDPQSVARAGEKDPFLTRLPVRLRMICSLATFTKLLGFVDRMEPLTEFQALRLRTASVESAPAAAGADASRTPPAPEAGETSANASPVPPAVTPKPEGPEELEVELVLARYLAFSRDIDEQREDAGAPRSSAPSRRRSRAREGAAESKEPDAP